MNFLIEGDNLVSLKLLEKTHKGTIDLIYIDPPYNTLNEDFIYDDKLIAADDLYRHSKWLSFMKKRFLCYTIYSELYEVSDIYRKRGYYVGYIRNF